MKITQDELKDLAIEAKRQLFNRALTEVLSRPDMQQIKDELVAEIRGRLVRKLSLLNVDTHTDVNKEQS